MSGRFQELCSKWEGNPHLLTIACILWLAWRVGTNPMRITYPCQRIAILQVTLYFSLMAAPLVVILYRLRSHLRHGQYLKIVAMGIMAAIIIGGIALYKDHAEDQLRLRGSGTITGPSLAGSASRVLAPSTGAGIINEVISTAGADYSVVSLSYAPGISYGDTSPYDPQDNPAYQFVWDTVERLGLGNITSPLSGLINPGDTVLIKPNWVDYGPAVFTQPQVVRPLIDMAIAAGAAEVHIGDGAVGVSGTNYVMNSAGYTQMAGELNTRYPDVTVETTNLNALSDGWHWVSLGNDSSFAGSGYTHYDLNSGSETLFEHLYYSTPDPQGLNPGGDTLGWYAVSDTVLNADVIINVPKMKTHQLMMATLAIKNLVGCTLSSTYDEEVDNSQVRIAHRKTDREENYFNNDVFWRAILDMNKIILYADEDGNLQSTGQRKYLNVVDGIQAMERSQHHIYGGGGIPYDRHVVLASADAVAVDAVASRIMGYDSGVIPHIENADSDIVHPIGTNDPDRIVILGEEVDSRFDHVFEFNNGWAQYAGSLAITDFTPPAINSHSMQENVVTADISEGLAAYVQYRADGMWHIEKMNKDGDVYSAAVPGTATEYLIVAQDIYFNTVHTGRRGDADGDDDIDVFDWVKVKRIILGIDEATPGADADIDGDVDVFDWVKVKRIILGLD